MDWLTDLGTRLAHWSRRVAADEDGFSTAELLGNAALGILALVAIWTLLQALGVNVIDMISSAILGGGGGG